MAFGAATNWEIETGGADANGGGFNPANANMATDLTTNAGTGNTAAPVVSSASYNFVAGDVGAWVFVQSGTNWTPGWYKISSVASNKATLSAAIGAAVLYSSTVNGNTGGANGLSTAVGVATVGTPTGGVWTIDYSQQNSPAFTFTDLVIDATTNTDFTSAAFPIAVNMVGNIINVTSGSGFTVQRVEMTKIVSGVIGRADKSLGTLGSTGGNGKLGGAFLTSGQGTAIGLLAGMTLWWASGTYTHTVAPLITTASSGGEYIILRGYNTTRCDLEQTVPKPTRPKITCATNSIVLLQFSGTISSANFIIRGLWLTHTAATRADAISAVGVTTGPNNVRVEDCLIDGALIGIEAGSRIVSISLIRSTIQNCTSTGISYQGAGAPNPMSVQDSFIYNNTGDGLLEATGNGTFLDVGNSVIAKNGGKGINFTSGTTRSDAITITHSTVADNVGDGLFAPTTDAGGGTTVWTLTNNLIWGNGGFGINSSNSLATTDKNVIANSYNFFGNNTSGDMNAMSQDISNVTGINNPFNNNGAGDYSLNANGGAGAKVRNQGFPGIFPGALTTGYLDGGAVRHPDPINAPGPSGIFFAVRP